MGDQIEEQEMEAEALTAIFDTAFEIISDTSPFKWSIKLLPIDCGGDEEEENEVNHVAVKLLATIPPMYPDEKADLDIEIIKVRVSHVLVIFNICWYEESKMQVFLCL